MPRTRGTFSFLRYYVLYLSLDFVHIMVMVPLCPPVLSRGSLLATPEAAEDVPVARLAKGKGRMWFLHQFVLVYVQNTIASGENILCIAPLNTIVNKMLIFIHCQKVTFFHVYQQF